MTDGQHIDAGHVVGPQGEAGQNGKDGNDGRDGGPGPRGEAGPEGRAGANGRDGKDGRNGADAVAAMSVEIGEDYSAELDARDIRNLRLRDLTVNGVTYQILCRS